MPKFLLLSLSLFVFNNQLFAQHADLGNGSLKNEIWWINWAGMTVSDGAVKTFTTAGGLTVTIELSAVAGEIPAPYAMNTWNGALLYEYYDFSDVAVIPALRTTLTTNNSRFTLTVTATRNGKPVPYRLIAVDAEACGTGETVSFTTSGGAWQTLEFYRNSTQTVNPSTGCGTQSIDITETYAGSQGLGQLPILATEATGTVTISTRLLRSVQGRSAVAFGIMAPADQGDLPAGYGYAQHQLLYSNQNSCNTDAPLPEVSRISTLFLGAIGGDADVQGAAEDGADEDALTTFPGYTGNGTYQLTVPVTNTTGKDAWLSGWFDYNRNGSFELNESVIATVPANAATVLLNWNNLPAGLPSGKVIPYAFRFRISSSQAAIQSAVGFAADGEVEDYLVNIKAPCAASLNTLPNVVICAGKQTQLKASGVESYIWLPATGLSATDIPDPIASPAVTTTYTVTGKDAAGCPGSASVTVYVQPTPVLTCRTDTMICTGTSLQLSAVPDIPATITWSPAEAVNDATAENPVTTPMKTTRYVATASTIYGCSSQSAINITVNASPQFRVIPDTPVVCLGQSIDLVGKGGDVYEWYTDNDSLLTAGAVITVAPIRDSLFKVYMRNNTCAVDDTLYVPVKVYNLPVTSVSKSGDIDCAHPEVTLHAKGGIYYTWEMAPGITNFLTPNPVVSPLKTTTYEVTITDMHGCSRLESITVSVDVALSFTRFPIPSAFTPNGDGRNDCFGLKSWGPTSTFEFKIFNRAGFVVFDARTPEDCWDGTRKGQDLPTGTYVYMVRARTICGEVVRRGTVLLTR